MPKNNETTTKFKVDISELKRAMSDAKRQISVTNSEFKAISSSMDNWESSTDGLSAKLKQLDSNLKSQKSILSALERQYELTVKEMGEGSVEADRLKIAINNQKAVVNKTEKEIKSYNEKLTDLVEAEGDTESASKKADKALGNVADSAEDAGDSAESAEGGFTVLKGALADLVADGIRSAIDAFKDLITVSDSASNSLQAQIGASTEEMAEFNEEMQDLYKNNYGESLEDIADKFAYIKQVTGETDPSKIKELTENAIALEDTFGSDFNETVRGVQSLMKHFGIDSKTAFDLFAKGSQEGLDYTDELGDNIAEYGGKFAEAGYSAEEYFQLLKNGSKGGAYNLDKVNDAINEVTTRLGDGTIEESLDMFSDDTKDVFKAWQEGKATQKDVIDSIVKDIKGAKTEQDKMNLSAKAFGTMAEDGGTQFIESLTSVGDTFDDTKGKMDEIKQIKYDDVANQLSGMGRTLKMDLIVPLVQELLPYLKKVLDWATTNLPVIVAKAKEVGSTIKDIVTKAKELSSWIPTIATALAGLGLAVLIGNFTSIITTMKTMITTTKLWTTVQKLFNLVMNANPIMLLVTVLATLVVAFITAYKTSDKFREKVDEAFSKVKEIIGNVVEWFKELPVKIGEALKNALSKVTDWIKNTHENVKTKVPEVIKTVVKFFSELPAKIWTWLVNAISKVNTWTQNMKSKATEAGKSFIENVINFIKELPAKVWAWLSNTIAKVTTWVSDMKTKATEAGKNFINNVIDFIKTLPSKIAEWFTTTITKVTSFVTDMKNKATEAGQGFFNNIVNAIKTLPDKVKSIGSDIVTGMWNGINDKVQWLKDQISGFVGNVTEWLKKFFKIGSPSKLMADEVGKWLPAGIAVGIDKNAKTAINSIKDMAVGMVGATSAGLNSSGVTGGLAPISYTQIINSPKQLSRLDIYRQSKNLLGYAGGGF